MHMNTVPRECIAGRLLILLQPVLRRSLMQLLITDFERL